MRDEINIVGIFSDGGTGKDCFFTLRTTSSLTLPSLSLSLFLSTLSLLLVNKKGKEKEITKSPPHRVMNRTEPKKAKIKIRRSFGSCVERIEMLRGKGGLHKLLFLE